MLYDSATRLAEAALRLKVRVAGSDNLRQRLVIDRPPAPADLWVHGASVGELTSGRPVIEALAEDLRVIVTANSTTGRDMVRGWGLPARLAPLDLPGALSDFLDATRPGLLVTLENEFWPLRSRFLARRGIRQAMIGARMSERSAGLWARMPRVIGPMLDRIAALSAQDQYSEARLLRLGLSSRALMPRLDLKLLVPARLDPPPPSPQRDLTLLAASTHEGEEEIVLAAWQLARQAHPGLRLILAIRHPQRGDEVAALIAARGLSAGRRSRGDEGGALLLADTLGEMPRWYAQAGLCFVGGSLVDRGGHTPWEPAAHGCAILHGHHVGNFTDAYDALDRAGAARAVDTRTLAGAIAGLVGDPPAAHALGRAARAVLLRQAGDPAALVARLRDLAITPGRPDIGRMGSGVLP